MAVNIQRLFRARSLFLVQGIFRFLQKSIISRRLGFCPKPAFLWKYFSSSSITVGFSCEPRPAGETIMRRGQKSEGAESARDSRRVFGASCSRSREPSTPPRGSSPDREWRAVPWFSPPSGARRDRSSFSPACSASSWRERDVSVKQNRRGEIRPDLGMLRILRVSACSD